MIISMNRYYWLETDPVNLKALKSIVWTLYFECPRPHGIRIFTFSFFSKHNLPDDKYNEIILSQLFSLQNLVNKYKCTFDRSKRKSASSTAWQMFSYHVNYYQCQTTEVFFFNRVVLKCRLSLKQTYFSEKKGQRYHAKKMKHNSYTAKKENV